MDFDSFLRAIKNKTVIISAIISLLIIDLLVVCIFLAVVTVNENPSGVKVDNFGDVLVLKYASKKENYYIEGIENSEFKYVEETMLYYNKNYAISEHGQEYLIKNSDDEIVGKTCLIDKRNVERNVQTLDLDNYSRNYYKIEASIDVLNIIGNQDKLYDIAIEVAKRSTPIDIVIDNVSIQTSHIVPTIFSLYENVDINIETIGDVCIGGGSNIYTVEDADEIQKQVTEEALAAPVYFFYKTLENILTYGESLLFDDAEEFIKVFEGVLSSELAVVKDAWGKVDDLVSGKSGADGLDGSPAILALGDVNIYGENDTTLKLQGGNGADGNDSSKPMGFSGKPNGGNGGNAGTGVMCQNLVNNHPNLSSYSGIAGKGGVAQANLKGDKGLDGKRGVVPETIITTKKYICL